MPTLPPKEPEKGIFRKVWRRYNQLREYCESLPIMPGRNVQVRHTAKGQMLTANAKATVPEPGEPGTIKRYRIEQNQPDYWVCSHTDGTAGLINIAKPWRLRRSPFHGQTIQFTDDQGRNYEVNYEYLSASRRKVTINSVTIEFQVVVPRTKAGFDYIFAMKVDEASGTGVTISTPQVPPAPPIVTAVDYIDINADGRAWARER